MTKSNKGAGHKLIKGVKLSEVHKALRDIVSSPYIGDVLELSFAALVNTKRLETTDAPLWLLTIGGPSSGKTNAVLGIQHAKPTVYYLSSFTDHSFISGFRPEDGSKPSDLLNDLDKKCLVVKDLTPMFTDREDKVKAVLGQLVDIYDGSYARFTGTRGSVSYDSTFSFVAFITPDAINKHQRYMEQLGNRFLFYLLPELTNKERQKGLGLIGDENRREKEERFRHLCSSYIVELLESPQPLKKVVISDPYKEELKNLADFIARGRSTVTQREEPFRVFKQLKALVNGVTLARKLNHVDSDSMELARRVAICTIDPRRAAVLGLFQDRKNLTRQGGLMVNSGTGKIVHPYTRRVTNSYQGVKNIIEELEDIGLLEQIASTGARQWGLPKAFAPFVTNRLSPIVH